MLLPDGRDLTTHSRLRLQITVRVYTVPVWRSLLLLWALAPNHMASRMGHAPATRHTSHVLAAATRVCDTHIWFEHRTLGPTRAHAQLEE